MITFDRVFVRFDTVEAVSNVSLQVARGEIVALLGPSGCGKSTLLRLLVGLERPTSGAVRVDNGDPAAARRLELQQRTGYVIQEGGLFPHLTARQNVGLLARHLGWTQAQIDARVDTLAGLVRLPSDALDRYPLELSGGQRQRVALMRALMLDPELLLLDEPLGALDPMVRAELQDGLAEIFAALKKTVVIVTHDLFEAAFFAKRLVLLNGGRAVGDGTLAALRASSDPFVGRFLAAHRALPAQAVAS